MDERVAAVDKVMTAMESLDHSEMTRGNVKAAMRAVESMRNELYKKKSKRNSREYLIICEHFLSI